MTNCNGNKRNIFAAFLPRVVCICPGAISRVAVPEVETTVPGLGARVTLAVGRRVMVEAGN